VAFDSEIPPGPQEAEALFGRRWLPAEGCSGCATLGSLRTLHCPAPQHEHHNFSYKLCSLCCTITTLRAPHSTRHAHVSPQQMAPSPPRPHCIGRHHFLGQAFYLNWTLINLNLNFRRQAFDPLGRSTLILALTPSKSPLCTPLGPSIRLVILGCCVPTACFQLRCKATEMF
jgi:hypothetical protein